MEATPTTAPTATRTWKGDKATIEFGNLGDLEAWTQSGKAAANATVVLFSRHEGDTHWHVAGLRSDASKAMAEARNMTQATKRRVNPPAACVAVPVQEVQA